MFSPLTLSTFNSSKNQNYNFKSAGASPKKNISGGTRYVKDYRTKLARYVKKSHNNERFNNKANLSFWKTNRIETQNPRPRKYECKSSIGSSLVKTECFSNKNLVKNMQASAPASPKFRFQDATHKYKPPLPQVGNSKQRQMFKGIQSKVSEILKKNSPKKDKRSMKQSMQVFTSPNSPTQSEETDFDTVFNSFQRITSLMDTISKNEKKFVISNLKNPRVSLQKELDKFQKEESKLSMSMVGFRKKIKTIKQHRINKDLRKKPLKLL
ncbi:unnamed protein product [Moneuplotes crassus]|uniref:Uncharacterized protein n=1 Tax=Euplotes crassus TaxID=5936 RepID=A0AAD1XGR0_EUPCR|nr:unnamed protein product [Moneuplotes crassus]